jgi:hypothetical protein
MEISLVSADLNLALAEGHEQRFTTEDRAHA